MGRKRKQNKLFSIKYQSYHRHHLIRISSCHKLQRAKKTEKTKFSSKLGPHRLLAVKKKSNSTKNVPLKHAFNSFGKWCSFPQELFNVKKLDRRTQRARGQEINAGRRETKP